jgi:hypothetical protein
MSCQGISRQWQEVSGLDFTARGKRHVFDPKSEKHASGAKARLLECAICGTAEQLAEKVFRRRNCRQGLLQGLKPDADLIGFIGPTKVVPLLQGL